MKILTAALVAIICIAASSCRSQEAVVAWGELESLRAEITADGIVTPEEAQQFAEATENWAHIEKADAESTDWATLLTTAGGTLIASILGANAYRNRNLPGTKRKAPAA